MQHVNILYATILVPLLFFTSQQAILTFDILRNTNIVIDADISMSDARFHQIQRQSNYKEKTKINHTNYETRAVDALTNHDYEYYTVRINSWKRHDQLKLVLDRYELCPGVEQIQVVWCTAQGNPPNWIYNTTRFPRTVVELHDTNSLNERFNIKIRPPTRAILSADDDLLIPCLALDAGFFTWTQNPDRLVGYDPRKHYAKNSSNYWHYSTLSPPINRKKVYSLTLTRLAFLHRDYLDSYTSKLPKVIKEDIDEHFNCEDIAMSLWTTASNPTKGSSNEFSQLQQRLPLLAPLWALRSPKSLKTNNSISIQRNHHYRRSECLTKFSQILGVQFDRTSYLPYSLTKVWFECSNSSEITRKVTATKSYRQKVIENIYCQWGSDQRKNMTSMQFWHNAMYHYQARIEQFGRSTVESQMYQQKV